MRRLARLARLAIGALIAAGCTAAAPAPAAATQGGSWHFEQAQAPAPKTTVQTVSTPTHGYGVVLVDGVRCVVVTHGLPGGSAAAISCDFTGGR